MLRTREGNGRRISWRRMTRGIIRYLSLGVICTYVTTVAIVWSLPILTFNYACTSRIYRWKPGSNRPYLWMRTWTSPYGTYFQIYTVAGRYRTLARFFDLEALPPEVEQAVTQDPTLADPRLPVELEKHATTRMFTPAYLPRWSLLHDSWPGSLASIERVLAGGGVWCDVRMGWPAAGLRGAYAVLDVDGVVEVDRHGAVRLDRSVAWTGRLARFRTRVGLPLIPDWIPFFVDVAFYAVVCFLVREGGRRLRRSWWWRRRPATRRRRARAT